MQITWVPLFSWFVVIPKMNTGESSTIIFILPLIFTSKPLINPKTFHLLTIKNAFSTPISLVAMKCLSMEQRSSRHFIWFGLFLLKLE